MEIEEIKDLTIADLKEKLRVKIKIYEQRKISHMVSPLSNPAIISQSRREIARIKTEVRQKEMKLAINE